MYDPFIEFIISLYHIIVKDIQLDREIWSTKPPLFPTSGGNQISDDLVEVPGLVYYVTNSKYTRIF